ncbi:glycine zipper 2TM domain-containing protein [Cereibacter azotoformans]|uniref:17 kDa surface antigen n=2 Tax=Cereibacter TaxID=1653176 RepID=A0A2T5KEH6_9RHOB|nr:MULTISPECIES: glycine zipper 2TM domain-containing protein [Cereibacter]AXQ92514.1 glycine zipper 2TM domain-containing protein [Cereibacter sphaeroides]MBO4169908.1 glycine zipper 2TM domain-containing protein [Cereibacter azotoformans]PTR20830.1 glycine zipper 2TM protein [Cereibacter azotoformans]UIJ30790.1 glycine zipper 2TM domain-containing protein [Cereibacter azotoformans]ULB08551.1 glycine zipper 2TM domain-containing protein [Cereibacter azotoformans]
MKKVLFILPVVALFAGCETADQTTAASALGGAALGAAVSSDNDRVQGAALGAAAGAIAGTLIGPAGNGTCYYRNARGQRFTGPC